MSDIVISGDTQPQPKRRRITEKRRAQNREAQRLFRERKRKKIFESLSHPTEGENSSSQDTQVAASADVIQPTGESSSTISPEHYVPNASNHIANETLASNIYNVPPVPSLENSDRLEEINDLARRLYDADCNRKRVGRHLVSLHWLLNDSNDPVLPDPLTNNSGAMTNDYTSSQDDTTAQGSLLPFENEDHVGRSDVVSNVIANYEVPVSDSLLVVSELGYSHEPSVSYLEPQGQEMVLPASFPPAIFDPGIYNLFPTEENPYSAWVASGHSMREIIKAGLEALAAKNQQLDFRISGENRQRNHQREGWEDQVITATEKYYLQELLLAPEPPLRHNIILEQVSVAKAILINAGIIGLHNPWPEDFKDNFKSPFVQSYFIHGQSIEAVKNEFAHLGASLRPSEAQCTTPHKMVIDALPFRGIKDKMMRARTEGWNLQEFDELEFCEDMGRRALICWGSGHGEYGGQPWDPRSWEARPWFLQKWSHIVDDELKDSSRWWRRLREEEVEELE
ncbi:hypothetical protein TWF696_007501 [Orbilia brochopaga]|uniref:BZIP domain-containing protein n=1 Tax=Orbilia brochopaga TaxID=3140254 RepID=A0AAV9UKP3_9PEZI